MSLNLNDDKQNVRIILAVAAVIAVVVLLFNGIICTPDSESYDDAWRNIRCFSIDFSRTPVYPVFIGVCQTLFGEKYGDVGVVATQAIIFLISIYYFYKACIILTNSSKIAFWTTSFYALNPNVSSWYCCYLTESLSTSGMVILIYLSLKSIQSNSTRYPIASSVILCLLIFMRPAFLFLLPLYFLFWSVLFFVKHPHRKAYVVGFCGTLFVSFMMIGYCYVFQGKYGVFTSSQIGLLNEYISYRNINAINPNATSNEELHRYVENALKENPIAPGEGFEEVLYITEKYKLTELKELIDGSKSVGTEIQKIVTNVHHSFSGAVLTNSFVETKEIHFLSSCSGILIKPFIFLILALSCLWVYYVARAREIPIATALLLGCCLGLYVLVMIGAPGEFGRLLLPIMPCYFLLIAQMIPFFYVSSPLKLM